MVFREFVIAIVLRFGSICSALIMISLDCLFVHSNLSVGPIGALVQRGIRIDFVDSVE